MSIAVNKDTDTLESIISTVNASAAGVTATYDASPILVVHVQRAGATVTLNSDTSGFLAAAKWRPAPHAPPSQSRRRVQRVGRVPVPCSTPACRSRPAAFTVNGVAITVDANDSINSVMAKITASAAGVTATYDDATDMVKLTAKQGGTSPVVVGNDTSGFLERSSSMALCAPVKTVTYSSFTSSLGEMAGILRGSGPAR